MSRTHLEEALDELLAFTNTPRTVWTKVWSNNPTSAAESGDPPAHRRRGDLPQPRRGDPPGWCRVGGAARVRRIQQKRYMSLTSLEQTKAMMAAAVIDAGDTVQEVA